MTQKIVSPKGLEKLSHLLDLIAPRNSKCMSIKKCLGLEKLCLCEDELYRFPSRAVPNTEEKKESRFTLSYKKQL